jgi:hypothetical protein
MESSSEHKIARLTKEDILNSFYNKHLELYVSATINTILFRNKKSDEIVGEVREGMSAGMPVGRSIKAKEALFKETEKRNAQKDILNAIKFLEDNEKEL